MTEHRHEWHFFWTYNEKHYSCIVAVVKCKICGLERGPTWIERRLNATEALSAEVATNITHKLLGDPLYATGEEALLEYARILGGEDETD